jgi:hypothetical protein
MDINSEKMIHLFNECVKEQVILLVTKICETEGLNWVEIAERYNLLHSIRKEYKPKKKRELKIPDLIFRCEAISAEGEQCKRSKKDEGNYCRRHKYKQSYGTIHNKKNPDKISIENNLIDNKSDSEVEIDQNGNIITLENGTEIIYIPSTGLAYTYTTEPKELGKISADLKYII